MSLDTKVKNLIINTNMTKEQYEAIDDKSNQLFFVEDSSVVDVPAPEENKSGYLHTDGTNLTWEEIESGDKLPDQTDNAGKFLTTDGTTASWGDAVVNNHTGAGTGISIGTNAQDDLHGVAIGGDASATINGVALGYQSSATVSSVALGTSSESTTNGVAIGHEANSGLYGIAIGGYKTKATGYSIQLSSANRALENKDPNTFKVANENGNFEMMSADGTIPTDRYTITPTTAGTYVPKLTIAEDGTATREWGTESGGESLPDQTDNAGKFLTTDGTTTSWSDKPFVNKFVSASPDFTDSLNIGAQFSPYGGKTIYIGTKDFSSLDGGNASVYIGQDAPTDLSGNDFVSIGYNSRPKGGCVMIGFGAQTADDKHDSYNIGIGHNAVLNAQHAIQLSTTYDGATNSDDNTFKVANENGNFEIMSADGTIPAERMLKTVELVDSSVELAINTIYNAGEMASLSITFPTVDVRYTSQLNFTSGATATAFTAPDDIKWDGDSIVKGAFVPEINKRYVILFYYDGINICAIARG